MYSVFDLSNTLNISARSIRQWLKNGRIRGVKVGVSWQVSQKNMDIFLNGETHEQ